MWFQFLRDFFLATPKLMVQKHVFCKIICVKHVFWAICRNFIQNCWHKQFFGKMLGANVKSFCRNVIFRHVVPVSTRLFLSHPGVIGAETRLLYSYWCRNTSFVEFVEISCKITDINSFSAKCVGQWSNHFSEL